MNEETIRELREKFGLNTAEETAALFGIDVRTLWSWEAKGEGPAVIKIGRQRFYTDKAIQEYLTRKQREQGVAA